MTLATSSFDMQAAFLDGVNGRLFSLRVAPPGRPRAWVVFVHALAEENAKSRHVVSAAARGLAARGLGVCLLDLYGCGDSDGSLAEAALEGWTSDVADVAARLEAEYGLPCHLWGMRSGAIVAASALRQRGLDRRVLVLWQPALRGKQVVTELLRVRVAASMMGGERRETVDGLRALQAEQGWVEIAGYSLGSALSAGLDRAQLAGALPGGTRIIWFDVGAGPQRELSPAGRRIAEQWACGGSHVETHSIVGPAFWSSGELQPCPALVQATVDALAAAVP